MRYLSGVKTQPAKNPWVNVAKISSSLLFRMSALDNRILYESAILIWFLGLIIEENDCELLANEGDNCWYDVIVAVFAVDNGWSWRYKMIPIPATVVGTSNFETDNMERGIYLIFLSRELILYNDKGRMSFLYRFLTYSTRKTLTHDVFVVPFSPVYTSGIPQLSRYFTWNFSWDGPDVSRSENAKKHHPLLKSLPVKREEDTNACFNPTVALGLLSFWCAQVTTNLTRSADTVLATFIRVWLWLWLWLWLKNVPSNIIVLVLFCFGR